MGIRRSRDPDVGDLPGREDRPHLECQISHVRVLDLPAPAHLLHDQLGVQADLDLSTGIKIMGVCQASQRPAVLSDIVGGQSDVAGQFGKHCSCGSVLDHSPVCGWPWIAPRATISLDDEGSTH